MKTQKGIREHDADELRKAKRLDPIRKSGKERHPDDYERFSTYLAEIIQSPDYIIRDPRPQTGMLLKEITVGETGEHFRIALRLAASQDPVHYKNSIITFLKIRQKEWERLIHNKEILYKAK